MDSGDPGEWAREGGTASGGRPGSAGSGSVSPAQAVSHQECGSPAAQRAVEGGHRPWGLSEGVGLSALATKPHGPCSF